MKVLKFFKNIAVSCLLIGLASPIYGEGLFVNTQKYPVPKNFTEAPMLAKKVAIGEIPPIGDRLPKEPFVVGPGVLNSEKYLDWKPGKHGGTIRVPAQASEAFSHEVALALGMSILRAPDQSTKDPLPAIVSEYKVSEDFTEFTLKIREGLKWSDGIPVTTEDVRMTFELYGDKRIYPTFHAPATAPDGSPPKLTILDKYKFKLKFSMPYGFFIANLGSWIPDYTLLFRPAHFIKQFHADYTDLEKIKPILEKNELDSWEKLVQLKDMQHWELYRPHGVGVPTLAPWVTVQSDGSQQQLVRNPYYWKVDIEGNQLPYVDKISVPYVNELSMVPLKAAAGDYDVCTSYCQLRDLPTYIENKERSGIDVILHGSINNPPLLILNQDYEHENPDHIWQKLMNDKRFGKALSLAIDSDDVNKNIYFGKYKLDGLTDMEHDPAQANKLLDSIGMGERDGEGFRLDMNGDRFEFLIEFADISPDFIPLGELLKIYFEKVGVRTTVDLIGFSLWNEKMNSSQHQAVLMWSDRGIWPSGISEDFGPHAKGKWAAQSDLWMKTGGKEGRKPPAYLTEYFDLVAKWKRNPPQSPKGEKTYNELMDWFGRNYVTIWPTGSMTVPTIFNADLGNVVKTDIYPYDRALDYGMEQLFYKSKKNR